MLQAASWGSSLIDYLIQRRVRADPTTPATAMSFLRTMIKIVAEITGQKEPLAQPAKYVDQSYIRQALTELAKR